MMQPFALLNTREASAGVINLRVGLMCLLAGVVVAGCGGEGTCKPEVLAGTVDTKLRVGDTCDQVHVTGVVYVAPHGDLSIKRGTTLVFEKNGGILVDRGGFSAEGTLSDPVILTGHARLPGYWKGVAIKNGSRETKRALSHTIIEYAGSAPFESSQPGALTIFEAPDQTAPIAGDNVTVTKHKNYGIVINSPTIRGDASCKLSDLKFSDDDTSRIYLNGGSSCLHGRRDREPPTFNGTVLIGSFGSAETETIGDDAYRYLTTGSLTLEDQDLSLGAELAFPYQSTLSIKGHSSIQGGGTLTSKNHYDHWDGIVVESGSSLSLYNITVDRAGRRKPLEAPDDHEPGTSLYMQANARATLEDVTIENAPGYGIRAEDTAELHVESTTISAWDYAARVGWPAAQGFKGQNDIGNFDAIFFDTQLDASELDVDFGTSQNRIRMKESSLRGLHLRPGNHLILEPGSNLVIGAGGLQSRGSAESPVVIESLNERWGGIRLVAPAGDNSVRRTVFRSAGAHGVPVVEISAGNTVDATAAVFIGSAGPGLHIHQGATVSGCAKMTFEYHSGPEITGAPCVD
jgi:hypothetical protein